MSMAGRDLDDDPTGFGPALDRSFAYYITLNSLSTSVTETVIPAADVYGFQTLMRAETYDLTLPEIAVLVDTSVDAPLTSAKFSQTFRAFKDLRDAAWKECASYGYGDTSVGGFKQNLDFLEPSFSAAQEFG